MEIEDADVNNYFEGKPSIQIFFNQKLPKVHLCRLCISRDQYWETCLYSQIGPAGTAAQAEGSQGKNMTKKKFWAFASLALAEQVADRHKIVVLPES